MVKERLPEEYRVLLGKYGLAGLDPTGMWLLRYAPGEYLSYEGEQLEYLQIITAGRVKISVSAASGKSLLYCFDTAGDLIGSIELMEQIPCTANAQAVTETSSIAMPMKANLEYFKSNLGFLRYLCTDLSAAFARSSKNSAVNILHPLQTRLCSYIAMTQQGGLFTEKLTETSELLGTSYRHLLRGLEALCRQSVLEKRDVGYQVVDVAALERMAEDYYSF